MKPILHSVILAVLFGAPAALGQAAPGPAPAPAQPSGSSASSPGGQSKPASTPKTGPNALPPADAYYYYTLGHLQQQQYELSSDADVAAKATDSYKHALDLEPDSAVIREHLAEIEAESEHIRDAVTDAQQALAMDPDNVDAHRLLARIYVRSLGDVNAGQVQQENLTKAVEQFQAILKLEPSDTYSALWLARLYRFENQHDDAEKVLRGVLHSEPDNEAALEQLSQLLVDEGRSKEAIDLLSHVDSDSASPDVYDLLGNAYAQSKDYVKAEQAYRQAVQDDPDDAGHRHGLAQALMAQGKFAEALEQFKKLSQLEPGTADDYLRMAELQRRLGQFDDAQSSLSRAQQLAPGNLEVLYNQALLDEDEGKFDDAIKTLTDAIAGLKSQGGGTNANAMGILYEQLGEAYAQAHNYPLAIETFQDMGKLGGEAQDRARLHLIETYRDSHDIDRAITEAKAGLDAQPNDPALTITLAMLYGEKSDAATATKLLKGLLHGNSSDQEIYIDIAQVQERGKQFADAELSAQKAEQLAQESQGKEAAWFMLGSIYERQKKFDEAEQQFRKVLDENPNDAAVLNYYGYMLADRGVRIDEATSMIQKALKQEPTNGAYLDSLGWAYYKQNRLAEAEEYLRKAVVRQGDDPTILSHLADVYLKLGQNERAAELLEKSLDGWQKASPADYEPDKVAEVESQLKTLKRRLAERSSPETAKPQ